MKPLPKNKAEFHRGGKAFLKLGFNAHTKIKRLNLQTSEGRPRED